MIKVLSKYYIEVPFINPFNGLVCEFFTLQVYTYVGDKNAPSGVLAYEKTIKNPESLDTNLKIDISNFVAEFVPINGACWVRTQVIYNNSETPELIQIKLASKGYTYGTEAINQEADGILTTGLEHKIARNQTFVLKILAEETPIAPSELVIDSITETTAPEYELAWTCTESILTIIYSYRLDGDTDWINSEELLATNPILINLPLTIGDYEVKITGIDISMGINITSNIFEITI